MSNKQSITEALNALPKTAVNVYNGGVDFVKSMYGSDRDFPAPKPIKVRKSDGTFEEIKNELKNKSAKDSIFNRYSLFFFNNTQSGATKAEDYYDSPDRLWDKSSKDAFKMARENPTTTNLIKWATAGSTNSVDYSWEDFLWCKDYGVVPNNYMITLRRFANPPADDLFNTDLINQPDIGRMITYIDGESNKWDSIGLKWSHGIKWKSFKSEIQTVDAGGQGYGQDGGSGTAGMRKAMSLLQTDYSNNTRTIGNQQQHDPYENANATFGPIDVIDEVQVRERGLNFAQEFILTFEYALRSIGGINPKIAFIDLLSNVLSCTANRGSFWGGDVRYYGNAAKKIKPFGDPTLLKNGNYSGFLSSMFNGSTGIFGMLGKLANANGGGILGAIKGIGSNMLSQFAGGQLDKMGRPEALALNSLLSGDPTGEWHVTIGNPANPIISVGNLILENTEIEFGGQLGPDDFPTKLKVTCTLKPAIARDRTDIISMFSRNNRTYLTSVPQTRRYSGQSNVGKLNGTMTDRQDVNIKEFIEKNMSDSVAAQRFPNHFKSTSTAPGGGEDQIMTALKGIY